MDMKVSVESIIEDAVTDLESANKWFAYLWEHYFSYCEEPDFWKHGYHMISAHVTAYKVLMDYITDRLIAAHSMSNEYHKAELKVLHEANN